MTEPIRVGIAVALNGPYALLGRQVLAGARCYCDDVNLAGGLRVERNRPRRPVELHVRDDRSEPSVCAEQVQSLINEVKVDLLLGPYGSGPSAAAAAVAAESNVVLWNHSGSADRIAGAGNHWLVTIISPASDYLLGIIEVVQAATAHPLRVALFSARTGFAEDVAAGVVERTGQSGCGRLTHIRYDSGASDFQAVLAPFIDSVPDCVLAVGRIEDDLVFASALERSGMCPDAVGFVVAGIDEFYRRVGTDAEGVLGPSQWEAGVRYEPDCGPSAGTFIERLRAYQPEPADYPAAQGYVGGLIAGHCVEVAGSLDQAKLRASADRVQLTTFYGQFRIEPGSGRQIGHSVLATQWQDGIRRVVWPPAAADAALIFPRRRGA